MSELIEVRTNAGPVLFDSGNLTAAGPQQVSRRGRNIVAQLDERLDDALASVRPAADAVIRAFQPLAPQELTVEFGLRLDAEAGAVIAKTGIAGHFTITMKWAPANPSHNSPPGHDPTPRITVASSPSTDPVRTGAAHDDSAARFDSSSSPVTAPPLQNPSHEP